MMARVPELTELPTVLRRELSPFECNVLSFNARGGVELVMREMGKSLPTRRDVESAIKSTKTKAATILARERGAGNGAPARRRDRRGPGSWVPEGAVLDAALGVAGVTREEAGIMPGDGGAGGARPPVKAGPPTLPPAPAVVFDGNGSGPPRATDAPAPAAAASVPDQSGAKGAGQMTQMWKDAKARRERIVELLEERPRSAKALAHELDCKLEVVRDALNRLGAAELVERSGESVYDWPGADASRGKASQRWRPWTGAGAPREGTHKSVGAELVAEPQAQAELDPPPAQDVVSVPEQAVQDVVSAAPEPAPDVQDPAPIDEAAARRVLARCEESRRAHARLAQEAVALAEEMIAAVDGELPDALLRARYLTVLLERIEAGDTSSELLDRFERLTGIAG